MSSILILIYQETVVLLVTTAQEKAQLFYRYRLVWLVFSSFKTFLAHLFQKNHIKNGYAYHELKMNSIIVFKNLFLNYPQNHKLFIN